MQIATGSGFNNAGGTSLPISKASTLLPGIDPIYGLNENCLKLKYILNQFLYKFTPTKMTSPPENLPWLS